MELSRDKKFIAKCERKIRRSLTEDELKRMTLAKLVHSGPWNRRIMKAVYYRALGWTYPYDGRAA